MKERLPLYVFFESLSDENGRYLGINDYMALLSALQKEGGGVYWESPEALLRLCKLFWLKPGQNEKRFEMLFEVFIQSWELLPEAQEPEQEEASETVFKESKDEEGKGETPQQNIIPKKDKGHVEKGKETPKQDKAKGFSSKPIYLNFEEGEAANPRALSEDEGEAMRFDFNQNFDILNPRALRQNWRFLRSKAKGKTKGRKLDIDKTIEKRVKNTYLDSVVFKEGVLFKTGLITFVDRGSSMLAMDSLVGEVLKSTEALSGLSNHIYYFNKRPLAFSGDEHKGKLYFYEDEAQNKVVRLQDIFARAPKTPVLLISDGGAAKGDYDDILIEDLTFFLKTVFRHTLKTVWLNPMPEDRWDNSSCFVLRELVDMFELSPPGLKSALSVLVGKKASQSNILHS